MAIEAPERRGTFRGSVPICGPDSIAAYQRDEIIRRGVEAWNSVRILERITSPYQPGFQEIIFSVNEGVAGLSTKDREALRADAEKTLIKIREQEYIRNAAAVAITQVADEAFSFGRLGNLVAEAASHQLALKEAYFVDTDHRLRSGKNFWDVVQAQRRDSVLESQRIKSHRLISQLADVLDIRLKAALSESPSDMIDNHSRLVARYSDALPKKISAELTRMLVTRFMAEAVQRKEYGSELRKVEQVPERDDNRPNLERYISRLERDIAGLRKTIVSSVRPTVSLGDILSFDRTSLDHDSLPPYFTESVLQIGEDKRNRDGTVDMVGTKSTIYPARPGERFQYDLSVLTNVITGGIQMERGNPLTKTWVKSSSAAREWLADPYHQESLLWAGMLAGSATGALAAVSVEGKSGLQAQADGITHAVYGFSTAIDNAFHQDITQLWSNERFARVLSPSFAAAYSAISGKPDQAARIAAEYLQAVHNDAAFTQFTKNDATVVTTEIILLAILNACRPPEPPGQSLPVPPTRVDDDKATPIPTPGISPAPAPVAPTLPPPDVHKTPTPPGPDAKPTDTSSLVLGEPTAQGKIKALPFFQSLFNYINTESSDTKGKGVPLINFMDARQDPNDPIPISIFSNQVGINVYPTDQKPDFDLNGQLFLAMRDPQNRNNRLIFPIPRPENVNFMRLNLYKNQIEFYDAKGTLVSHLVFSAAGVGELVSDIQPAVAPTAKSTEAPTVAPSPSSAPATLTPVPPTPTETLVPKKPELKVEGSKFMEDGKEIILKGAVVPHFLWGPSSQYNHLTRFKTDAQILKNWGAASITIDWNAGFLDNPKYVESLVSATEFSKNIGIKRVILNLHSDGLDDPNNVWSNKRLTKVDDNLVGFYSKLFGNPEVGKRLRNSVDMFVVLSEPEGIRFSDAVPVFERVAETIKLGTGKPDAVVAYGLPDLDFEGIRNVGTARLSGRPVEVHLYDLGKGVGWNDGVRRNLRELRQAGINVYVGEFGWSDSPDVMRDQINFFNSLGISWSAWGMVDRPHNEPDGLLRVDNTPSDQGKVVQEGMKNK